MKKMSKVAFIALFLVNLFSCSEAPKTTENNAVKQEATAPAAPTQSTAPEAKVTYSCSMNCEKGKTYDVAGKCPVCKMNLVSSDGKKEEHKTH
jgi:PBP1b-binding outer membrane lipoprotein LpoB